MGVERNNSISIFITKILWIIFLISQESNLVICGDLGDDSLQNALDAIERRQRNLQLQENDYYGQPENIGYGFQKNFGFFDNVPARELGSADPGVDNESDLQNVLLDYLNYERDGEYDKSFDKRKSNFRERFSNGGNSYLVTEKENGGNYGENGIEYLQLLKNLWSKYTQGHPEGVDVEDLSDEQVEEILSTLNDKGGDEDERLEYGNPVVGNLGYENIPLRTRRNYRVFDHFNERRKRYPSFGEGIYGKRNTHSQHVGYETPAENDFLYSLKFVNPESNREAVEQLKDSFDVSGDETDKDVIRLLNNVASRPKYVSDEDVYWLKDQKPTYDRGVWWQEPVSYPEEVFQEFDKNDKRATAPQRIFKQHNGLHLNKKRFPVKRSSGGNPTRVRKQATDEKVAKELKEIFGTSESTTVPPKKKTSAEKKPTVEGVKKINVTKPEVTKHHEATKKVVRRSDSYSKEKVYPPVKNQEITELFRVNKKSVDKKAIDWSQYFGLNKRSPQVWFRDDNAKRAESYFLAPKSKRFPHERSNVGNVNFLDQSQYEMPFDTRIFHNDKRYSYDIGSNIENMENKIGNIEEKIIDKAVKYTGAHSGGSGEDLGKVKSEVIHDLEAAYSLEKMKSALEEFKNSIKGDKHLAAAEEGRKSSTESPKVEVLTTTVHREAARTEKPEVKDDADKNKRVAVKKEGVENLIKHDGSTDNLEFLNWPSTSDETYSNGDSDSEDCPVLYDIAHNCLRVEEVSGRYAEMFLPICTLQQVCFVCGSDIGFSTPSSCDLMYLTEAQNLCQGDKDCLLNARESMLALRNMHEREIAYGRRRHTLADSCLSNPCIRRFFLNSPGAVIPLDLQK